MKKLKRLDEFTLVLGSIVWTSNILKSTYMKSADGYEIESIVIKGTRYFPSKKA